MKLKNIFMTGVLVASISTGSVAFAASNPPQFSHAANARSNKQEQIRRGLLNDIALILNIDQTTFFDQLKSGQSIREIAEDAGVTKTYVIAKLISKEKTELDKEVSKGTLTGERRTQILFKVTSRLSTMMDQTSLLATESSPSIVPLNFTKDMTSMTNFNQKNLKENHNNQRTSTSAI